MASIETHPLQKTDFFHFVEIEEATLFYRPSSQQAFHIDQAASAIWNLCDGTRTAEMIGEEISSLYPEDERGVITQDVIDTVDLLCSYEIIERKLPEN